MSRRINSRTRDQIEKELRHTTASFETIARAHGLNVGTIARMATALGISRAGR